MENSRGRSDDVMPLWADASGLPNIFGGLGGVYDPSQDAAQLLWATQFSGLAGLGGANPFATFPSLGFAAPPTFNFLPAIAEPAPAAFLPLENIVTDAALGRAADAMETQPCEEPEKVAAPQPPPEPSEPRITERPGKAAAAAAVASPLPVAVSATQSELGHGSKSHRSSHRSHRGAAAPPDERKAVRNMREQKRSMKINQQIDNLKGLMESAGVRVKPNKYSILSTVVEHMASLQRRSQELEEERKLWMEGEIAAANRGPPDPGGGGGSGGGGGGGASGASGGGGSSNGASGARNMGVVVKMECVTAAEAAEAAVAAGACASGATAEGGSSSQSTAHSSGIDYRRVFESAGIPQAIATTEGAIVDCNRRFEDESGYSRAELLQMTLFSLTRPTELQQAFARVGELITTPQPRGNHAGVPQVLLLSAWPRRRLNGIGSGILNGGFPVEDPFMGPQTAGSSMLCVSVVQGAAASDRPRHLHLTIVPGSLFPG